jgi:hypothetical protein
MKPRVISLGHLLTKIFRRNTSLLRTSSKKKRTKMPSHRLTPPTLAICQDTRLKLRNLATTLVLKSLITLKLSLTRVEGKWKLLTHVLDLEEASWIQMGSPLTRRRLQALFRARAISQWIHCCSRMKTS